MRVLHATQRLLTFTGLQFHDNEPIWYKIYRVLSALVMVSFLQPQIMWMMENLHDIIKVTDVLTQIIAEFMSSTKLFIFWANWKVSRLLLRKMQSDFDKYELQGRPQHFERANKEGATVTQINNILLIFAGIAHSGGPLLIILMNYLSGTLQPEMWVHPFKVVFLFDYKSSLGYVIGYVLNITYNVYVASYFGAIDTLYVGVCLYSLSYLDYVKDHFEEIKMDFIQNRINKESLGQQMRKGILIHYETLEFINDVRNMFSGIIFTQFAGVILILSTISFQILISQDGKVIMFIAPGLAVIVELFLFCYYGNKLTSKSLEVIDCIYQCNWYDYPVEYQRFLGMMIIRMQRPIILSGFGFIYCTLPTFISVIRMVGSVIAVFQSIE